MDILGNLLDLFLHLDKNLALVISQIGIFTYIFLFLIIFMETGLVITPFLPGDSLLFAAGTLAVSGNLNILLLFLLLSSAAILGDTVNYWIGAIIGPKIFEKKRIPFLKKEYLTRTEKFYEKHGGKTIILARFIPIIRTFAPFVAGIGKMSYSKFASFNIIGGIAWVALFLYSGYFFGNLPLIRENFHYAIFGIIFVSILPAAIEYLKHLKSRKKNIELELD
ncbi:hypothetical protein A2781_03505 [Candidatus Gottesmanbacteria bacterium RIFCSPHIGHO2_01_FULL_42_27]|nr:MAG: hypothetical protein UV46_C0069G0013 [Candidatus Gottesmanbacteria bacterium GW2011_GWC2_42_8]OGG12106.1 MAG: hypothetical protein A2781_03505 [Candidatus Gottesmanbacteria bacterium RIFCSPHIGHO2_01_FULL_42_27]OGG34077.1 MAG: hypothetical protein A3G68_05485 [Candidatus Gottesmanbacteria bacterium RIFCSPLOWO2_12_FULL_42_10]